MMRRHDALQGLGWQDWDGLTGPVAWMSDRTEAREGGRTVTRLLPDAPDPDPDQHDLQAAIARLIRMQEIMHEMLDTVPAPPGPARQDSAGETALVHLSRQKIIELAIAQGHQPLHSRPETRRGLRLVGHGDDPLYVTIDRHLRLHLDRNSNRVGIERLRGRGWSCTGISARKDGCGGITLDAKALERAAGPFSPPLRRALTPGSS